MEVVRTSGRHSARVERNSAPASNPVRAQLDFMSTDSLTQVPNTPRVEPRKVTTEEQTLRTVAQTALQQLDAKLASGKLLDASDRVWLESLQKNFGVDQVE